MHAQLFRSIADLRAFAAPDVEPCTRLLPFGLDSLDVRLGGGLRAAALHEFAAVSCSLTDDATACLFAAGLAARAMQAQDGAPVLWVSARDDLYAPGLEQAGLAPGDVIHAHARDDAELLAVMEDAVRDGTPAVVVGEATRVPMIATRRLQLAAADADVTVLMLRLWRRRDADPLGEPSAAWTRWRIGVAPSAPLDVPGVGRARWAVELARRRGGDPFSLILEGCDATGRLAVPAAPVRRADQAVGTDARAAA